MLSVVTTFAASAEVAEEATDGSILNGLGIDFTLLILQAIAFLLTVFVLAKYVYPVFMRIIDERDEKIAESTKAADEAKQAAEKAEKNVEAELKKARSEAADIVATAKAEASQMVSKAESDAKTKAERIVAEAQEELQKDILAAQKALEKDTIDLVKRAASLSVNHIADDKLDTALVKQSVQEARR